MFHYIVEKLNISLMLHKTRDFLNSFIHLDKYYNVLDNTNDYYQISQSLIQYKNSLDSFLTSKTLISLYSRFALMESLLLFDGVVCSVYFLREFLILKLSSRKLSKRAIMVYNEEIVEKYNSLYRLSTLDRYVFYFLIYVGYNTINYFYEENQYSYLLILPIVLPYIQNSLLGISFISKIIDNYIEHKDIFIKYSMSKMSVHFVQQLHPQIEKIQNYHIFIIYKTLSIDFVWKIITNCLFIALLNILRSYDSTYYYYKGIKMAYYYNIGYLYNIIPLGDAIYLANIIIKEKRWRELDKLEVVNAFFTLVVNKYEIFSSFSGSFWINCQMILFQLFSLYSIVSVLKLITIYLSGVWVCALLMVVAVYLAKLNVKNIITSILIYFLIIFNINDLIITLVIITHKIVYYWLEEIYFFVKNTENVKKVIKMYETPSREAMVSKIRDEYIVC
jgi:hypothetical protein